MLYPLDELENAVDLAIALIEVNQWAIYEGNCLN